MSLDQTPTTVAAAGDWHGRTSWAVYCLDKLAAERPDVRTILHLGDFGIWPGPGGQQYLTLVERACAKHDIEILVTLGNHEDWGRVLSLWMNPQHCDETGDPLPIQLTEHISALPRGWRFEIGGRSIVSLGGAPSVDFDFPERVQGKSWWREEAISDEDVAFVKAGGAADIMLAHDSPDRPWMAPAVEEICYDNSGYVPWSKQALAYAAIGRGRMTEAFAAVAPRLFLHGHYHVRSQKIVTLPDGRTCSMQAVAADEQVGNVVLIDLETLKVTDF